MRKRLKAVVATAVVALSSAIVVVGVPSPAQAHGSMMQVGSRAFLCWKDGLTPQGNIQPTNAACAAARAAHGDNAFYNWFSLLKSDSGGRVFENAQANGYIPDGKLCSANNPTFAGYDIARADYPVSHVTAGASFFWKHSNWAAHPGTFFLYATNSNYSPTRALAWSDLDRTPFLQVTNPSQSGAVGTNEGHYFWSGNLPTGKTGRGIIFAVWSRSDSMETFYGCSDVVYDGGNGFVTGTRQGTILPSSNPGTVPPPEGSNPPPSTPDNPGTPGSCAASFRATSTWSGGFQGEVTVSNPSTAAISGWTATWPQSATVANIWGATQTTSGGSVTAKPVDYTRVVNAGQSVTFGFVANGTAPTSAPAVTCTSP